MTVNIREASVDDAEVIAALNTDVQDLHANAYPWLFKASGPDTFTPQGAKELISKPNFIAFLAYVDAEPVGYVVAEVRRRPESEQTFALETMFVHQISVRPSARRNGVGKALLNAVKAHGAALDIFILALDTWTFNDGAQAFFKSYGLVPYNVKLWNHIDE